LRLLGVSPSPACSSPCLQRNAVKAKPVAGRSSEAGWELIGPDPGFGLVDVNGDGFLCFRQLNSGKGIIIDNNVPF
jgi:hypothetical protein